MCTLACGSDFGIACICGWCFHLSTAAAPQTCDNSTSTKPCWPEHDDGSKGFEAKADGDMSIPDTSNFPKAGIYARIVATHPAKVLLGTCSIVLLCIAVALLAYDTPDFSSPQKGFEPRKTDYAKKANQWRQMKTYPKHNPCGYFCTDTSGSRRLALEAPNGTLSDQRNLATNTVSPTRRDPMSTAIAKLSDVMASCYGSGRSRTPLAIILARPKDEGSLASAPSLRATCDFVAQVESTNTYKTYCRRIGSSCCPVVSLSDVLLLTRYIMNPSFQSGERMSNFLAGQSTRCQDFTEDQLSPVLRRVSECTSALLRGACHREGLYRCSDNALNARCSPVNLLIHFLGTFQTADDWALNPESNLRATNIILPMRGSPEAFADAYDHLLDELSEYTGHDERVQIVAVKLDAKGELFDKKLIGGVSLAALAVGVIAIFLVVHTKSVLITLVSLVQVCCSMGWAYFAYKLVFGIPFFSFLCLNMIFVAVAIGVDDIFVFVDAYKQSYYVLPATCPLASRLQWTFNRSFAAMFVTTLTTTVAFLANLVSPITAIKSFSVFAATVITLDFILMMTVLPSILVLVEFGCCQKRFVCFWGWNEAASVSAEHSDGPKPRPLERLYGKLARPIFGGRGRWVILVVLTGLGVGCLTQAMQLEKSDVEGLQLFVDGHLTEEYDQKWKNHFRFEREQAGTGFMKVLMVAGLVPSDSGNSFNPDDHGPIEFSSEPPLSESSQAFLLEFCQQLQKAPLFQNMIPPGFCFGSALRTFVTRPCVNAMTPLKISNRWNLAQVPSLEASFEHNPVEVFVIEGLLPEAVVGTVVSMTVRGKHGSFVIECMNSTAFLARETHSTRWLPLSTSKCLFVLNHVRQQPSLTLTEGHQESEECCGHSFPLPLAEAMPCALEMIAKFVWPSSLQRPGFHSFSDDETGILLDTSGSIKVVVQGYLSSFQHSTAVNELDNFRKDVAPWMSERERAAPANLHAFWFADFAFWDLQTSMNDGAYQAAGVALISCVVVLLLVIGNVIMALFASVTIIWILASVVATLKLFGWKLDLMVSIIMAICVGMCVDFVCHMAHSYTHATAPSALTWQQQRLERVMKSLRSMGISVTMGAITTMFGGLTMLPSSVKFIFQFGSFMAVTMFYSFVYSMFYYPAVAATFGVVGEFGHFRSLCVKCRRYFTKPGN